MRTEQEKLMRLDWKAKSIVAMIVGIVSLIASIIAGIRGIIEIPTAGIIFIMGLASLGYGYWLYKGF